MTHRGRPPHGGGMHGRRHPGSPWLFRAGPSPLWALAAGLVAVVATLLAWGLIALVVVAGITTSPTLMMAVMASVFVVRQRRRRRRAHRFGAAGTAPLPRHAAPPPRPPRPDLAWSRAHARFTELRTAYAAHECDPMAVLHL